MARDQHESHENKVASSFITDKTPRSALEASGYDPDLFDVVEKNVNGGFHQRTQWIRDYAEQYQYLDQGIPFIGTVDHLQD